ncbi:gp159 [Sphingomonas phage PAU]|uniref:gp159 n=1 Tax=Sphingomonas phage PAU TaxID=1150991 RepID=UPI00025732EB|nr:gp159 [Sphingomonas phage PAU]AFF28157.1 gp159 [Sphingomonas phage PAU]
MRPQLEIDELIEQLKDLTVRRSDQEEIDAILNVLENDLSYDEIESLYFDENVTDVEQQANKAREFMDGGLEADEIMNYYIGY